MFIGSTGGKNSIFTPNDIDKYHNLMYNNNTSRHLKNFLKKIKKISKKVLTKLKWSDIIVEHCEESSVKDPWKLNNEN